MGKSTVSLIKKNPTLFLIIYGIALRLIILFFYQIPTLFPDSDGYIELATKISTFSLEQYDGTRSLGYPLLIASLGNSLNTVVIIQLLLGILTSILCFKIALQLLANKKISFFISFFFSSLIHIIFFETLILTETLTYFIVVLIFYLLLKNRLENSSFKQDFWLSILLGYLILIKPFYIFFPFLIFIIYSFNNLNLKKIIGRKLILFIFPLFIFLGWSYINKINTGYFISTTLYGFNIAQNCVSFAENTSEEYQEIGTIYAKYREKAIREERNVAMSIWDAQPELSKKMNLSLIELSNTLSQYSKATIKLNPIGYLEQVFISWWDFWKTNLYIDNINFKSVKAKTFFEKLWYFEHLPLRLFKLLFLLTIPFQVVSFFKSKKIDYVLQITLLVLCASILQALVTYGTNSRFSYPFEFLMVIIVLIQAKKYYHMLQKS